MFVYLTPSALLNWSNPYCQHEAVKHRQYEERVREIKHGSFSPLVFSASGGISASTVVVYKHLSFLLSTKWKTPYSYVISWLHCCLSFSLLNSVIVYICGFLVTLPKAVYHLLLTLCLRRGGLGQHRFFILVCRFSCRYVGVGFFPY